MSLKFSKIEYDKIEFLYRLLVTSFSRWRRLQQAGRCSPVQKVSFVFPATRGRLIAANILQTVAPRYWTTSTAVRLCAVAHANKTLEAHSKLFAQPALPCPTGYCSHRFGRYLAFACNISANQIHRTKIELCICCGWHAHFICYMCPRLTIFKHRLQGRRTIEKGDGTAPLATGL